MGGGGPAPLNFQWLLFPKQDILTKFKIMFILMNSLMVEGIYICAIFMEIIIKA